MAEKKKVKIGLGSFDFAKGLGILTVIFCHLSINYPVSEVPLLAPAYVFINIVSSGLMPMFFIISGYGFKKKQAGKMLKKTFNESFGALFFSLIVFSVLVPLAYYPVFKHSVMKWVEVSARRVLSWLLALPTAKFILGVELLPISALWFLIALFWAQNILNQIVRIKNLFLQIGCVGLSVLLGLYLYSIGFVFYCIPQGFVAVFFCYIGYILKSYSLLEKYIHKVWPYLVMVPVCLVHFALVGRKGGLPFDLASGKFGFFDFIAATISGLLFVFIGVLAGRCTWKWAEWIKNIGVHTYWILCLHSIEILGIPWWEISQEKTNSYLFFGIEIFIKIVLITSGCMMLKKISYYRYMKKRVKQDGKLQHY